MTTLGRILEVDLASRCCTISDFPAGMARNWLGGRAFNVAWLYRHLSPGTDPLSPENPLLFSCGLLTGAPIPTSSRLHVNALSPMTGLLGSSNVGSHFGAWLRSCGFQSVIIRGQADSPVRLEIGEDGAEIRDAADLWGLDTFETQERIESEGEKVKVLVIGPAGENRAPMACIVTDQDHAAGRTGMGAVMGSKRLKAIVVRKGKQAPVPARPEALKAAVDRFMARVLDSPDYKIFSKVGGAGYVKWAEDSGTMGARYYRDRQFPGIDGIDGAQLEKNVVRSRSCFRCPIHCKAVLGFKEGRLKGKTVHRPEFEPMINLGAKCGLGDMQTLIFLDNLCSRLGLDSISAANGIAFAMDLRERGILSTEDADGLDLSWGNGEAMETLIRQMAAGKGLGGLLARGVRAAAAVIDRGAEDRAAHVKGLELTAYHPAGMLGTALGYAVSSRGGDYNNVYASLEKRWSPEKAEQEFGSPNAVVPTSPEGKGRLVARAVRVNGIIDSLGLCKVPTLSLVGDFDLVHEAELAAAVTGWENLSADELMAAGTRLAALERRFNLRHGLEPEMDRLPAFFLDAPDQPLTAEAFQKMLSDFYADMGWDAAGRPIGEILGESEQASGVETPENRAGAPAA
jgi:aldehyde:ferredoxin oxidoreductase